MLERLGRLFKAIPLYFKFKKTGIGFFFFLRYRNKRTGNLFVTKFLGKSIKSTSPFWLLHSIEELFIQEIYKFSPNSDEPYIIDCGANWGLSCIYFKQLFPKARIDAFEPDPSIFNILTSNLNHFSYQDIQLHKKAVWKEKATLAFNSVGALGGALENEFTNSSAGNVIKVEATDIRHLLNQRVDLLKIDIEGAEFEVLDSIKECLEKVDHLFVEYHSTYNQEQHLPAILSIMKNAGFRIYIMEAWKNNIHPFVPQKKKSGFDLQLNLFGYRN